VPGDWLRGRQTAPACDGATLQPLPLEVLWCDWNAGVLDAGGVGSCVPAS
jgi:hypothetical protein